MKNRIHNLVYGYMLIVCTFNADIMVCILRLFVLTGRFGVLLSILISLIVEVIIIKIFKPMLKIDEYKLYKELEGSRNEE